MSDSVDGLPQASSLFTTLVLRIGARFGFEHDAVYLHRGHPNVIRNLGLDSKREPIEIQDRAAAIQRPTPGGEAEDFLSIYKERLEAIRRRGSDPQ